MAKYITRTVEKTKAVALIFDKETAEAFNESFTVSKATSDAALERAVRKLVESDPSKKLIEIVDRSDASVLMGITEEDFLAHAVTLDATTRKPVTEEN